MNPILRNVLIVIAGIIVGSFINSTLVALGPSIIPLPEGADNSTMEKLAETIHLFGVGNFMIVFLAHALGTLVGAYIVAKFAASRHFMLAMFVGAFFLLGGITAAYMIGGPSWFIITDLALAYLPMGWLGWKLAGGKK